MATTTMSIDQQVALLMQGTAYGDQNLYQTMANELRQRLLEAKKEGRPLRVYCGFDPTSSDLHLGHTVPMRKMYQFQELGHEVIFVVGSFTSLIGDPSDKDKLRPQLTMEQVQYNAQTYAEQAYKILNRDKTQIRYNSEWLASLSFEQLIQLASNFTVQQFLTRENFRKRWDNGEAVYLHETFYAIMQGYDAYALNCDVQIGGTDQLFNIVTAARKIMSALDAKPNIAIILDILPGTDGEIKMSKSLGNHIPLLSTPEDMYGKVMSVPDQAMVQYFRLLSRLTPPEIMVIEKGLADGSLHPRDVKMQLAREIVSIYHNAEAAVQGEQNFIKVFQEKDIPDEMPEYSLQAGQNVVDVLVEGSLAASRSEARRLVQQNGVRLDGEVLSDPMADFPHPGVLQAGKRKFLKVK